MSIIKNLHRIASDIEELQDKLAKADADRTMAEIERDEARDRYELATALLREWREDDGLPSATHNSKRGRTDAFLASQPARAGQAGG